MIDLLGRPEAAGAWAGGSGPFRALADHLEHGLYVLDAAGRCLVANAAFARRLGRPEATLVGRTIPEIWPLPWAERETAAHARTLAGESTEREEDWPDGIATNRVRVLRVPLTDDDGTAQGVLGLVRALPPAPPAGSSPQAERLELLGRLAAGVVHDLNNLLAIQMHGLAALPEALPPSAAEALHALRTAVHHGAELTGRLLRLVRGERLPPRPVDVNAVCAEAVALLRTGLPPRVAVEARLSPSLPAVRGDAGELARVVLNLGLNAGAAMPDGGRLTVETESRPGLVCLHLRDTGGGIAPEVAGRLFEPFVTGRPGAGTGLGLAVVRAAVEEMGGRVECHSRAGEGTRFTVRLPARDDPAVAPAPAASPAPPPATSVPTVLIVEPDAPIATLAETVLRQRGFRTLRAEDGRRAVELLRQSPAEVGAVLLELNLPGLSGLEAMNELLDADPRLAVVLVSGAGVPEPSWRASAPGLVFLSKPYTPDDLVKAVRDALAARGNVNR